MLVASSQMRPSSETLHMDSLRSGAGIVSGLPQIADDFVQCASRQAKAAQGNLIEVGSSSELTLLFDIKPSRDIGLFGLGASLETLAPAYRLPT